MNNKSYCLTLLIIIALVFASCAGSRGNYQRKGYGCPSTAYNLLSITEVKKV
jgi:hypothetical protein